MDKTNNLQHFLTDIADAIREKKGTTDLINAQSFADEIKNLSQSGGSGGGETSSMEYIDVSGVDSETAYMCGCYSNCVRWYSQGIETGKEILQITPFSVGGPSRTEDYKIRDRIQAIAIDFNLKVLSSMTSKDTLFTVRETLDLFGLTDILDTCPRITEEEFYNLNA